MSDSPLPFDSPPTLDEETERLIRGILTTFKPGHPNVAALRQRILWLIRDAVLKDRLNGSSDDV